MESQSILDMCCGSRMFWLNKRDERAVFADIRAEEHILCDGRRLVISPDLIADFRALPFADSSFPVVVFDPPHLERVGQTAWMGKKYGRLNKKTWRTDIRAGFKEAFRVLRPHGVLIFKWNETQIPVSQILALTDVKPIIGQRTGKNDKTHWIIFVKG
ncbi:class I SAM-dependent methyltransferase [Salmonella enterica]|uniref:Class I SAM-dependent methyltransferase n=1 Tax=Salmonella oranienberg TaxID=28147 RepID=A0A730E9H1_SALON|nr:class I SAM-dependent methyltransferase [Salmonella enterica]ECS6612717.1 class I SAM-dependent methyltransferase [Salmonella enterica subsp. enterica serovar Give]ECS7967846.1 class I SAM-dependent methyltransferase [Salmonella enterica subsp. enterica serovar Poona]EED8610963.1 class I SAM-dependent methyltransferase [Salmonella enterica subsp. enterica serovar Glostrup]HAE3748037.1 class I SAM-dependent methyltransferase [Salmonella enterica subsp. enterica serovar Oranienburg]